MRTDVKRKIAVDLRKNTAHFAHMSYAQSIIDKFGGVRATAAALMCPPSTVQGWKNRGTIPDDQKQAVLDAGLRLGLRINKEDFWPARDSAA